MSLTERLGAVTGLPENVLRDRLAARSAEASRRTILAARRANRARGSQDVHESWCRCGCQGD